MEYWTHNTANCRSFSSLTELVADDFAGDDCGAYSWTWTMERDGGASEPLDTSVFTFDESAQCFQTWTDDPTKADMTYDIYYTVSVPDYPSISPFQRFAF